MGVNEKRQATSGFRKNLFVITVVAKRGVVSESRVVHIPDDFFCIQSTSHTFASITKKATLCKKILKFPLNGEYINIVKMLIFT